MNPDDAKGGLEHLVFYGSLRRGEPAHEELGLEGRLRFERIVRFPGCMYDLGAYPGVVLEPPRCQVEAELHFIEDPGVLDDLDAFELYSPTDPTPYNLRTGKGSLYLRKVVPVEGLKAWVYVYNGDLSGLRKPKLVPSGRWPRSGC